MAAAKRPSPSRLRRFVVEALEPRLLYSADLGPSLLGAALVSPVAEHRLFESEPLPVQPQATTNQTQAREVVFVDAATPDADRLVADLAAQSSRALDVVRIGANEDGLARISAELAARQDVSAVHIISHGSDGAFRLGASTVDSETVQARRSELAGWSASLTADADLLIYGCDVAQSTAGQALVERLAAITGADVAASTNLTGSAALGGDLTLEFRSGAVEAQTVLNEASTLGWQGLLAVTVDTSSSTSSDTSVNSLTFSHTVSGSGSNRFLLVTVGTVDSAQSVTSVTYGGTALTQIGGITEAAGRVSVELWYLKAPAAGTADVVVNLSGGTSMSAGATTFFGVDQTTPYSAAAFAEGGGGEVSVSLASAAGELVVDAAVAQAVSSFNAGPNQTQLWNEHTGNTPSDPWNSSSIEPGAASVTMSWTKSGSGVGHWASGALSLKAAPLNTAPVLTGGNAVASIVEDASATAGTSVSNLISGQMSDADAGAATGIAVTAVDNSNGTWQYSTNGGGTWSDFGTPSASSARLLAADADTYVRFVPNADWSGTVGAGLTFRGWDQTTGIAGGTADVTTNGGSTAFSAALASSSITVTPVNDAPTNTVPGPLATGFNAPLVLSGADRISVADVDAANNPLRITLSATNGSLTLATTNGLSFLTGSGTSDAVMTFQGTIDSINAALDGLRFTPAANYAGGANIQITSEDLASQTVGNTVVFGSNSAPGAFDKQQLATQITVPAGGTLTSITAYLTNDKTNTVRYGIYSDSGGEPGTLLAQASAILPAGSGWYTLSMPSVALSPGDYWIGLAPEKDGSVYFAAAGGNTRFSNYDPKDGLSSPGWTGTYQSNIQSLSVYASFTSTGGTSMSDTDTIAISVAPNTAPSGASNAVTTVEDGAFVFSAGDFGFNDVDGNALAAVKVTTLPAAGTLTNNGIAVTAGQFISAADLAAGLLSFSPAAGASGAPYASFTFQVQDDGGTANGGSDLDPTARTMTVNVNAVNNAPVLTGANNLGGIFEDDATNSGTLVADLIAGQVSDADAGASTGIAVVGVDNTNGTWQYSLDGGASWSSFGAPTAASARLLAADASTYVRFVPNAGWNGTVTNGVTFRAWDRTSGVSGGTADTTSATLAVRDEFSAVSYANNDGTASWSTGWVDADGSPAGGNIRVTSGELLLSTFLGSEAVYRQLDLGAATAASLSFSYDNQLGLLGSVSLQVSNNGGATYSTLTTFSAGGGSGTYTADLSGYLAFNTRIRFAMSGTLLGGSFHVDNIQVAYTTPLSGGASAFSAATAASGIAVASVNDAPAGASNTVTTLEDTPYVFAAADFGFSDADGNTLAAVRIATLPGAGTLTNNGVAVTAGQAVSAADIAAGLLRFTPAPNANGTGYASFTFQVQDDGGTANGGVDVDPTARTVTVNVTSVNDAPSGANTTVTTLEDTAYAFTASDFGFNDGDGNALFAIRITSLPAAGVLTNNGVPVSTGQTVLAADVAGGLFRFTPAANASGAAYASFTFLVRDDGGTANGGVDLGLAPHTMIVNVTAVNDAPAGAANTVATLEDTAYVFAATDFGFSDTDGNAFAALRIASLPAAGTLTNDGVPVSAGQVVSAADVAAGLLRFTPAANASGAGYASFTFQVQDDGGGANGGINLDPTGRTMTVNVTSVNDAPAGANNTVTTLEDAPYVFASADFGFSDTDGNALAAVRITSLPGAGTLTSNGVAVSAGQVVSAADIAAGLLRFTPVPNANGTAYAGFSFQVQDDGGTANGGVDVDGTARTMTVNVTAVNDAPSGADNAVTALEDTAYVFAAADFGFTDTDGNALVAVRIATLPVAGTLTHNGVAVSAGQVVSAADIASGLLRFTPAPNANGAGYASFTFQVQDDGGTSNGGVDVGATARTMTVNVTAVSDAPSGANNTVTTLEDSSHVFTAGDFGFSDVEGNALAAVRIASLPASGALTNNGVAVTAGQFVSAADIAAGLLRFSPASNANGAGYANFTFQVQDDGGTANGGVDLDPIARSMTLNVTAVNDAPAGSDNSVTTLEDAAYVFAAADFGFSDTDGNALAAVRIATLPIGGALTNNGVAVSAGQVVSAADIAAGLLRFAPAANANGAGYASFTFQVRDDGGTANGGVDLDATARTMTVNVTAVNDAPAGANNTVTILEDTGHVFAATDFGFVDSDGNAFGAVRISSLPAAGALTNNGVAVSAGQIVSAADIASGLLRFAPAPNANGAGYASFTFQVQDDGGTANGGADVDATARTMTVNVTAVNDGPSGANNAVTTLEDTAHVFTAADFGFSDADGNALAAVRISALPGGGTLTNNGVAVSAGQMVSAADIASGLLRFSPAVNANGAGYASFTFQVQDDGGTANGGADLDATARTITVSVTAVNDAPSGQSSTVTLQQDGVYVFSTADFGFSDGDGDSLVSVLISTVPTGGTITDNGAPVSAGQAVSAANIAAGLVRYTPFAGASGSPYASFDFRVQDSGGTANGGVNTDALARAIAINVIPAPLVAPVPVSVPGQPEGPAPVEPVAPAEHILPATSHDPLAAASARLLLASNDFVSTLVDAEEGLRAPVLAQALVRDPVFVSSQRLGSASTMVFGGGSSASLSASEDRQLDFQLVGLTTLADSSGGSGSSRAPGLAGDLDRMRDEMGEQADLEHWVSGSMAVGSFGLTVGYVLWLLRGGALLASLLSSLPAWRLIDPLPVLSRVDDEEDDDDDQDAFVSFETASLPLPVPEKA